MKQENRGGKRPGAGRPKKEPTTTIRIPFILKPIIERYVKIKMGTSENYYKVLVWFRYVSAGEVEKDFEIHYTYAVSQEDAKRKVTIEHYSGHSAIPFKYEVNQIN